MLGRTAVRRYLRYLPACNETASRQVGSASLLLGFDVAAEDGVDAGLVAGAA